MKAACEEMEARGAADEVLASPFISHGQLWEQYISESRPSNTKVLTLEDPRSSLGQTCDLIGFYYPNKMTPIDILCEAGFLSNFWETDLEFSLPEGDSLQFQNAEAAFQATKYMERANEFTTLSGEEAFKFKKRLNIPAPDFTYGGYGSNWDAMYAVLKAKFSANSEMERMLLGTADAYLLEHNAVVGRDKIWSDNGNGDGSNWLGLLLMLLRDELRDTRTSSSWTAFIEAAIDTKTGAPRNDAWQQTVRAASLTAKAVLSIEGSKHVRVSRASTGSAPTGSASACASINQEDDRRAKRAARFGPITEDERKRAAASVASVRAKAFAPVHPSINNYKQGNASSMLGLGAGRLRIQGVDHYATQQGKSYLPVDKCRGPNMDVTSPPVADALRGLVRGNAFDATHISQGCSTWSPALCLGQDGGAPIGQYRSPTEQQYKAGLDEGLVARCREANAFKALAVELALKIDEAGGSVSFESTPSCKDPADPWYISYGEHNTADHFSYFDDDLMQSYIRKTGSVMINVHRCAATTHESDNGYRKVMCFLVNKVAAKRAHKLRKLEADGCSHTSHRRLRGNDANGVSHSRHAEEYPPQIAEGVAEMHDARTSVDPEAPTAPPPPPPLPPPKAPPKKPPPRSGPSPPKSVDGASATGKRVTWEAPPATRSNNKVARGARTSAVFLVCILAHQIGGPLILVHDGALPETTIPGGATSDARATATLVAATLVPSVANMWAKQALHYAARIGQPPGAVEHVVTLFAEAAPSTLAVNYDVCPKGWALVALAAVHDAAMHIRMLHAVQLITDIVGDNRYGMEPGGAADGLVGVHDFAGVGSAGAAHEGGLRRFEARRQLDEANTNELRTAIADETRRQAAMGDFDMAAYLDEALGIVRPAPAEDVGEGARAAARNAPKWLKYEPFRDITIEASKPLPIPRAQEMPTGDAPKCKADIIDPTGMRQISTWFDKALAWLLGLVDPDAPQATRPETLVIGQDRFYENRRGVVWDCRRESEGIITPLDFTAKPKSHWDTDWLRDKLADYPCRESISHLCDGADYKADLPLSFCFTPHLLSIGDADGAAYDAIYADLQRLKDKGYYEWFTEVPFAPWGLNGQGTRPKPPNPLTREVKFRRIVSGGDPYEAMAGDDGVPRPSVNAATRKPYRAKHDNRHRRTWRRVGIAVLVALLLSGKIRQMPSLWRGLARFKKERKPRALDIMYDLSIMGAIAVAAGLPLFVFVDDFAEFFYQFRLASHCLWYCGIVMLDKHSRKLRYIVELVMAMGFAPSSNISQMGSEAFLFILDKLMEDADVVDKKEEAKLHEIMTERQRRHGGTNGRPRRRYVYTDDAKIAVIGTKRFIKAVMTWRVLLRTARILAADAYKRQLGTHAVYVGVRMMVALGYASVPEAKLLKALNWVAALRSGTLDKETAKRCFGLLVHLVFLDATLRATTAGMWRCTARWRPNTIKLTDAEDKRAERWERRLQCASAVEFDEAVRRGNRRADTAGGLTVIGQSDACREKEKELPYAALGGYSHGVVWTLALPKRAAEILPISADELLAFIVHIIVNQAAHGRATRVLHALDNINALLAVTRDSARAPIMAALIDIMLELSEFQLVRHKLLAAQWFGARLTLADAASRGYKDLIHSVAIALRIKLTFAEIPRRAHEVVQLTIDKQERLLLLEQPQPQGQQPKVLRGSVVNTPSSAPPDALVLDTRRPGILGNMMLHVNVAAATAAYARVLDGEPMASAGYGCKLAGSMAHATTARVAAAISAIALYVRGGGDVVLQDETQGLSHTTPLQSKIHALAETYLQRPAMPLQMARMAIAAAGVRPQPPPNKRRGQLQNGGPTRRVAQLGMAAMAPKITEACDGWLASTRTVLWPVVLQLLIGLAVAMAVIWVVRRFTAYASQAGVASTRFACASTRDSLACASTETTTTMAAAVRRTGLLGGARNRNQDYLMVGNRVRKRHRQGLGLYDVTDVDTTQRYAYETTDVLTGRERVTIDLKPTDQKEVDEMLTRVGQWQLLPNQKSIVPFSNESYVCVDCYAQSTFYPCVCCQGVQASGHFMVMSGDNNNVIILDGVEVQSENTVAMSRSSDFHDECQKIPHLSTSWKGEIVTCYDDAMPEIPASKHTRPATEVEGHRGGSETSCTDKDGPSWKAGRTTPKSTPRPRETGKAHAPLRRAVRSVVGKLTSRPLNPTKVRKLGRVGAPSLATDLVRQLDNDTSRFALKPADPGMLERMGIAINNYAQFGANKGTVKGEASAWRKYWLPFTKSLNTPEWRTNEAQSERGRESLLQVAFAVDVWQRMNPRSHKDAAPKVQSAFNVLGHIRRMHSRRGYEMPSPAMLSHVSRGMSKQMLLNYGKHSLVPARAEPFTADQNHRMLSMTPGTLVNKRAYEPTTAFWRGWRLLDTFANQAGERKSGIIGHELGEYQRADVLFVLGGATPNPDPSPAELRTFGQHPTDRVILRGGPSKADRYNQHFGAAPRVFKYNRANSSNFAAAMVDVELAYPVRGSTRHATPLFVQDGKTKRWTASAIDRTLDGIMAACLTAAEREHKTFHSKRVWLASAFKHLKHSEGEIQALVHWRSPESIRIYGRMDEVHQMNCRERACTATFTVMNACTLPQVEPIRYTSSGAILMPELHDVAPLISAAA